MHNLVLALQIIIGVAMSALILLQSKGTGLGRTFGSTAYHSRRGLETLMFRFTIILAVLFVGISILGQIV